MLHKAACSRAQTKARQTRLYCVVLQIHALTSTKSGRNLAATLSYRTWKMKNDIRYWQERLYKEERQGHIDSNYSVRIAHSGRRERSHRVAEVATAKSY